MLQQQNQAKRKGEKIAVISLTTAKIDVRNVSNDGGENHSEKQNTMEPDETAQLEGSKKRLGQLMSSPAESARSHQND